MERLAVWLLGRGGAGRVICPGTTVMAGRTFAMADTEIVGILDEEVLSTICPETGPSGNGWTGVTIRSKFLPGSLVLIWTAKALLLLSTLNSVSGSSIFFTMRKADWFGGAPAGRSEKGHLWF